MARTNYSTYLAIKRRILDIFRSEKFENNKLPPESQLAKRLGISLVTLREALLMLAGGDYEGVFGLLREDVAADLTEEDIQGLALRQLDGAGVYKQIESRMATGQSSGGEDYGVAVFYCEYSKKDVLVRLAFDPDYALIGLEIKKQ